MTPRAGSWAAPSYPPPTGVLVGGPYGSLDARSPQASRPPGAPPVPASAPAGDPGPARRPQA